MQSSEMSPFPNWGRPFPDECRAVTEALVAFHGRPRRSVDPLAEHCGGHGQTAVLDSLVRTILSQNTTDKTSIRAFKSLKQRYASWSEVLDAPDADVEEAIRVGGLAAIKVQRIKALLRTLQDERGACCLEWLREEATERVKAYLSQFKGIGAKTMSCVLMFCLERAEFPVDTHVWHISKALGWCPPTCTRDQAYEHLNALVPDDVKYDLHVLMVEHGKMCASCNKGRRGSSQCPLTPFRNKRKTSESKERTVVKEGLKKLKVEDCGEHSLHGARGALGRAVKEEVKEEDAVLRTLGTVPRTVVNKLVAIKKEEHQ